MTDDNGVLSELPEPYHYELRYTNLIEPPGGFEQDFLSKDYFLFTVVNNDTNEIILNLTNSEFNLNLPQRFDFYLPNTIDTLSGKNILRIYVNGELIGSISLIIEESKLCVLLNDIIIFYIFFFYYFTYIFIYLFIYLFSSKQCSDDNPDHNICSTGLIADYHYCYYNLFFNYSF